MILLFIRIKSYYTCIMNSLFHKKPLQAGIAPVIIIAAVLIIGAIGGGAVYYSSTRSTSTMEGVTPTAAPSGTGKMAVDSPEALTSGAEVSRSFEQIFATKQNLECTWKPPATAGEEAMEGFVEGKLWTTGDRGRSTAKMNLAGMESEVNAIYNEKGITSWASIAGQKFGFIITNDQMQAENEKMTEEERRQAEQYRDEMIVSCKPWTPDETYFEPPADVSFDTIDPATVTDIPIDQITNIPDFGADTMEQPSDSERNKMMRELESR